MNYHEEQGYLIVYTIFLDKTRRKYKIPNKYTAGDLIGVIQNDTSVIKPPNSNPCLVYNGKVLERDRILFDVTNSTEIFLYCVLNPFVGHTHVNRRNVNIGMIEDFMNTQIFFDEAIIDLTDNIPGVLLQQLTHDRPGGFCLICRSKAFWTGFFVGAIVGPLSLVILPCFDFDLTGVLGMCVGVVCWVVIFLIFALRKRSK